MIRDKRFDLFNYIHQKHPSVYLTFSSSYFSYIQNSLLPSLPNQIHLPPLVFDLAIPPVPAILITALHLNLVEMYLLPECTLPQPIPHKHHRKGVQAVPLAVVDLSAPHPCHVLI